MTKIKICGIKTPQDALAAVDAGAELVGFNFYPRSPRFIDVETCSEISRNLRERYPQVTRVGVFVNAPVEFVKSMLKACSLDLAQLHGDETFEEVISLEGQAYKAFRGIPEENLDPYLRKDAPVFLLDASVSGKYGGTGIATDWSAASELAKKYDFLLAGGLTPKNVGDAIRKVHPWGVDVASGVESSPGIKDIAKIKAFVKAVESAG